MKTILLAAGGTGGHIFPAESLAQSLQQKHHRVIRITDARFDQYRAEKDKNENEIYRIPAASPSGGIVQKMRAGIVLLKGVIVAVKIMREQRPAVVVGFGGYPSFPAVIAAWILRIPTIIHEQNAVLGRANRVLAYCVNQIAVAYSFVKFVPKNTSITLTGNPVREAILKLYDAPYPEIKDRITLLITGGSQGAGVFSDVIPKALSALPESLRARLHVVQQCREEDIENVRAHYHAHHIKAELARFFTNMPEQLSAAHIVIARAGASTLAEICIAGKPSILVPYPYAMDDHQTANAEEIERTHAGVVVSQSQCTPNYLKEILEDWLSAPEKLYAMSKNARAIARPNAAGDLCALTLSLVN